MGKRMSNWVNEGYSTYVKRLDNNCNVELTEIPLTKRTKNMDINKAQIKEGELMLEMARHIDHIIALNINAKIWSTEELANKMNNWQQNGTSIALMIGGPEGLAPEVLKRAHQHWSLSHLTMPHPLVRILVAEQIYRAWSILKNHPYHR